MTSDIDRVMREAAREREQLTAAIGAAQDAKAAAAKAVRWTVVRQYGHRPDEVICRHRLEWLAEWCARFRSQRHTTDIRAHYTVRRAAS